MKTVIFLILFLIHQITYGQRLSFSHEIISSKENSILAIKNIWTEYFNSTTTHLTNRANNHFTGDDIVKYALSSTMPLYTIGHHFTFSITKQDENTYKINTLVETETDSTKNILFFYSTYACKKASEYSLMNQLHFDIHNNRIKRKSVGNIQYYYAKNYKLNSRLAQKSKLFLRQFCKTFNIENSLTINYIIGNTLDEANSNIGFNYTILNSSSKYAGLSIYPNYILSCRENHYHELVHAIMRTRYPMASSLYHEGIATYFGGSSGMNFNQLVSKLKTYLSKNPNFKIEDGSINNIIEENINISYIVGALLIEEQLQTKGAQSVLDLFSQKQTETIFDENSQIWTNNLHTHICNLIQKKT